MNPEESLGTAGATLADRSFRRLRLISIAGATCMLLTIVADLLSGVSRNFSSMTAMAAMLTVTAVFGLFRGLYRVTAFVFPALALIMLCVLLVTGNGIHDSASPALLGVVILAALFLGKTGALAFTLLSMLAAAGIISLEMAGMLGNPYVSVTTWGTLVTYEVVIGIGGLLLWFVMRELEWSLSETSASASLARESAAEVRRLNEDLEKRIDERTRTLRETQSRLVESEKMGALGRISAALAHQINSPLGAIVSASTGIQEGLRRYSRQLGELFEKGRTGDREFFLRLVSGKVSGLEIVPRERRKLLAANLRSLGVSDAEDLAEKLLDMGVGDSESLVIELIGERPTLGGAAAIDSAFEYSNIRKLTEVLRESAQRAHRVVDALKTYTDEGFASSKLEKMELRRELSESLELLGRRIGKKVDVVLDCPPGLRILGRAHRLQLVWTNLESNAADAMPGGGELAIRARAEESLVVIEFVDSGKGIPFEHRSAIFKPFFTTKRLGAGLGLGLDIARRVVEDHGGTIEFESEPGRTAFRVRLPLAADARDSEPNWEGLR